MFKQILFIAIFALNSALGPFALSSAHADGVVPETKSFGYKCIDDRYATDVTYKNWVDGEVAAGGQPDPETWCPGTTEAAYTPCDACGGGNSGLQQINAGQQPSTWQKFKSGGWAWMLGGAVLGGLLTAWWMNKNDKNDNKKKNKDCIYIPPPVNGGYYSPRMLGGLRPIPGYDYGRDIASWYGGGGGGGASGSWSNGGFGGIGGGSGGLFGGGYGSGFGGGGGIFGGGGNGYAPPMIPISAGMPRTVFNDSSRSYRDVID